MATTKINYQFVGGACLHAHPQSEAARKRNPFNTGWERLTLSFSTRDWFNGPINGWLKEKCAQLGIPWYDRMPKDAPVDIVRLVAASMGAQVAEVSEEEQQRAYGMWAALAPGASIFQMNVCVTPGCVNYDDAEQQHLLPEKVDVVIHAPQELVEMVLSDLYDWNHASVQPE